MQRDVVKTSAPFAIFVAAVLGSVEAAAQDQPTPSNQDLERYHAEIVTTFWRPAPALVARTASFGAAGIADFDFAEEFDLDRQDFAGFSATAKLADRHKVRVAFLPIRYEKTSPLRQPLSFDGASFTGVATASFDWSLWRFGYEWDFVRTPRGFVGLLTEVSYQRLNAWVRSGAVAASTEPRAPVPVLGATSRFYLHPRVSVTGEFSAFAIAGDAIDGTFVDVDAALNATVWKTIGVRAGYRLIDASYRLDDNSGDLRLSGPYFGLVSRF